MKRLVFLFLVISFRSNAQDPALLQKQLVQIMSDFTNKFENLKDSQNPLYLKFKLSGTTDNGFIMGDDKVYISFRLPTITTTKEAKELFDKWVQVLDKINFNGVKMLGTLCENNCGEYVVYSKVWAFDDKRKDLSPLYYPFKISLESMNIEGILAISLFIGNISAAQ
ncbi:MAG TPA: hypothetical protein PK023_00435 [Chitinophagaceae bacterium]|nr:hypothetical protein [Chitinophagaceae bacterium]